MADFNRNNRFSERRPSSSRGGGRGGDRFSRGPVEMHRAVCDNCGKDCEVPFRPTQGKPIFCSNCFEKNGPSNDRRSESQDWSPRRSNQNDREMFDAVCDNCSKNCKIPFRPTGGRPVYCSDCFEKGDNDRDSEPRNVQQPQRDRLQEVNVKLDKILELLSPAVPQEAPVETVVEEVGSGQTPEKAPKLEKKKKAPKKI